ncbi:phage shock protein PspC (stress-responsive transcriptional regulator) [Paenibacillus sp. DS2015]|uniref:PspC domain-containing protein n=1 Tax=Paenibacillus sp. DS2015 TaxID=3373917 RepID=UPI003D231360
MSKLYRSTKDKMVTGLCGGLSDVFGIDSTLLRFLVLLSIPFTGGTTLFVYFVAALVIPKESLPPFNHDGHGYSGPQGYGSNGRNNQYNGDPRYGNNGNQSNGYGFDNQRNNSGGFSSQNSELDEMMKDIEKKALKKEVEELKIKLSKYEKGEV